LSPGGFSSLKQFQRIGISYTRIHEEPALSVEKETMIHCFLSTWTIQRPVRDGSHGDPVGSYRVLSDHPKYFAKWWIPTPQDIAANQLERQANESISFCSTTPEKFTVSSKKF
jgi:hypothetical protein